TIGAAFFAVPVALPIALRFSPVSIPSTLVVLCALAAIVAGAVTFTMARKGGWSAIGAVVASVAVLEVLTVVVASPIVVYYTAMPVVEQIRQKLGPDDEVALYGGYFPNVPFYLGRIPY